MMPGGPLLTHKGGVFNGTLYNKERIAGAEVPRTSLMWRSASPVVMLQVRKGRLRSGAGFCISVLIQQWIMEKTVRSRI